MSGRIQNDCGFVPAAGISQTIESVESGDPHLLYRPQQPGGDQGSLGSNVTRVGVCTF